MLKFLRLLAAIFCVIGYVGVNPAHGDPSDPVPPPPRPVPAYVPRPVPSPPLPRPAPAYVPRPVPIPPPPRPKPGLMPFQGYLTTASGVPLSGNHRLRFCIGGPKGAKFCEEHKSVPVIDGSFEVQLITQPPGTKFEVSVWNGKYYDVLGGGNFEISAVKITEDANAKAGSTTAAANSPDKENTVVGTP